MNKVLRILGLRRKTIVSPEVVVNLSDITNYHNHLTLAYVKRLEEGRVSPKEFREMEREARERIGYSPN